MIKNLFSTRFRSRLSINEGGEILMSCKSLTCLTVFCALVASQALAVPTIDVSGTPSGGNVNWTVSFTPDATLLNAGLGTLATELMLETTNDLVGGVTIDPNWSETINGTPIVNPGDNPYTGAITEGVTTHPNVASELPGGGADVNAIFAALGSTKFTTNGAKLALSFTTMGSTGTVNWGGILAQDPNAAFVTLMGSETVGGTLLGDANNDGAVTGADLGAVSANFGNVGPPNDGTLLGDANDDGAVTGADLGAVSANFGNVLPGALSLGATAVPEPSTVMLTLLLGGVAAVGVRRLR
jgi:hypothetical protein